MSPEPEVSEEEMIVYRAALNYAVVVDEYGVELGWASDE